MADRNHLVDEAERLADAISQASGPGARHELKLVANYYRRHSGYRSILSLLDARLPPRGGAGSHRWTELKRVLEDGDERKRLSKETPQDVAFILGAAVRILYYRETMERQARGRGPRGAEPRD